MNTLPIQKKKKILTRQMAVQLISILCALLFLYAAFYKLMDYRLFRRSLELSPLIRSWATLLSIVLPIVEVILAMMLMFDRRRKLGFYGFLTLMLTFSVYIFWILNFSPTIPCSCGGVLQRMSWTAHLVFNLIYILLGIIGLFLWNKEQRV